MTSRLKRARLHDFSAAGEPNVLANRKCVVFLLVLSVLCDHTAWAFAQTRATEVEPGLVIIVEGIGGLDIIGLSADHSFKKAGLPHEIHHFNWTHGIGRHFRHLQDTQHVLKKANELAAFIRDYRARHPNRPIYVIGKSGGTGLVLLALQTLPANTVERVILLSAAVAPTFDLRDALRATRREVVSFHSRHDRLILGWGTSKFGTIDRYYGPSAGLNGFTIPERLDDGDRVLYRRLVQVPFSARMLLEGTSAGGHQSTSMPWFLSAEVVPWLR
jgi:pimeloyl-ACP methyl ester carboxylesterase